MSEEMKTATEEALRLMLDQALEVLDVYANPTGYTDSYGEQLPADATMHEGLLAKDTAATIRGALSRLDAGEVCVAAAEAQVGGWNYDLKAAPNGLMEFAFTNSLGFSNVRICERMGHHTDSGLRYFYCEDGRPETDLNANGWRAYAWRKIDVPPVEPPVPETNPSATSPSDNLQSGEDGK